MNTFFKKIYYALFVLTASLQALYVGNPSETGIIDEGIFFSGNCLIAGKMGYQGDLVFDRKVKAFDGLSGDVGTFRIYSNQGMLALNVCNRLEFFGLLGEMSTKMRHEGISYNTSSHFLWGVGARALLLSYKDVAFGASGLYQQSALPLKTLSGTLHYEEWQVGAGISYQIRWFTPYIAASYSEMGGRFEDLPPSIVPHQRFVVHNRNRWGIALGTTLSSGKWVDVTLEGRVLAETAITLSVNVKW